LLLTNETSKPKEKRTKQNKENKIKGNPFKKKNKNKNK